jgi:hypothetical protein
MPTDELKQIFDFIRKNGTSNARQIGKAIPGGKSRANHYLYGYLGILFAKRGLTPPQWNVVSDDAYEQMTTRLRPRSMTATAPRTTPAPLRKRTRSFLPAPVGFRFILCLRTYLKFQFVNLAIYRFSQLDGAAAADGQNIILIPKPSHLILD